MKVIEVKDVSYIYPDGSIGVKKASLDVYENERLAILGANGSGKSTLLMIMAGLLKPTRGEVRIFGLTPERKNLKIIRKKVGIVFQDPDDFLFNPTVRDELLHVPLQLEWSKEKIELRVSEISKLFGLDDILEKPPFRISGGEKKKVAIASVVITNPDILIIDEPTANIDGKSRREIIKIMKNYSGTLIFTTHELEIVKEIASRVVIMNLKKEVVLTSLVDTLREDFLKEMGII